MNEDYSFAIEDDLLKEFFVYRHRDQFPDYETNQQDLEKLLSFQLKPFIFTRKQLNQIGYDIPKQLEQQLLKANLKTQSLEDLSKKTLYKGILSKTNNPYPYINIHNGKICPAIIGMFNPSENRNTATEHLKQFLLKAKEIIIQDYYLLCNQGAIDALKAILPQNNMVKLIFPVQLKESTGFCWKDAKQDLLQCYSDWNIQQEHLSTNYHDRYIVVDRKWQVILSSGLAYMISTQKDLTYVISPFTSQLVSH